MATVRERNTERLNFRITPRILAVIQQAASRRGMPVSSFIKHAAFEVAIRDLEGKSQAEAN